LIGMQGMKTTPPRRDPGGPGRGMAVADADQLDCCVGVASLTGKDTKKVQRVGRVGEPGEHLTIDRLRLGLPAS
jgi:hypothetical protein